MEVGHLRTNQTERNGMGNAIEYKPTRGAIAAAARKLGRHRQSVYRSFRAGDMEVLAAVAEEDCRITAKIEKFRREFEAAKGRASKLAEAENIRTHDEYLREKYPEKMSDYSNS